MRDEVRHRRNEVVWIVLAACSSVTGFTVPTTHAASAEEAKYVSPDGAMGAVASWSAGDACETKIVIASGGREIVRLDYTTEDHEHGNCLGKAEWTNNSQFFVFSLDPAGGHHSWNTPIMFFSRQNENVLPLEKYSVDPVTDFKFSLFPPDVIEFETTKLPLGEYRPVRRSLRLGSLDQNQP